MGIKKGKGKDKANKNSVKNVKNYRENFQQKGALTKIILLNST